MSRLLQPTEVEAAAKVLSAGRLLGLPTETVYGLAADAENEKAVKRIYQVKGRPNQHPVIVHIASFAQLSEWATEVQDYAMTLAKAIWPGPLTLVLKRSKRAGDFITGGQDTVALRVPNHKVALAVLRQFGGGVAAPSANRFGAVSPTRASDVQHDLDEYLKDSDAVIDGGDCSVGVESTIVDCTGVAPKILRTGGITAAEIERITGLVIDQTDSDIRVPGGLPSHYAPKAKVRLAENQVELTELLAAEPTAGVIALSDLITEPDILRLAAPTNAQSYAQILYRSLRQADELGLSCVIAVPPTGSDIALAVADRLRRAAHQD